MKDKDKGFKGKGIEEGKVYKQWFENGEGKSKQVRVWLGIKWGEIINTNKTL